MDFGTAVNFDVVSREGEYVGGVLAPGVEISLEALTERGAKLPKIDLAPPRAVIGKSTVDAIRSGVIYGYAALVDGIVHRLPARDRRGRRRDRDRRAPAYIVPFTETIDEVDELLTLTGLRLLYERNAAPRLRRDFAAWQKGACRADRAGVPSFAATTKGRPR